MHFSNEIFSLKSAFSADLEEPLLAHEDILKNILLREGFNRGEVSNSLRMGLSKTACKVGRDE